MKLVEKLIMIDDKTFAPKVRITLDVALELIQDDSVRLSPDDLAKKIGHEFIGLLKAKNETNQS